ncbi:MAG: hypothetical protein ACF8Q5_11340 [Phycisphaerales bacterium JB040]
MSRCASIVLGGCVALVAYGCGGVGSGGWARDLNARPTLGGSEQVPGLVAIPVRQPMSDTPSLRSVSRVEWSARRVVVPVDGTAHTPIHRWGWTPAGDGARRQGLWPTAQTALRLDSGPASELRSEALWAPLEALGEALLLPIDLVLNVGASTRRASPWALHKRYPETGEWRNVSGAELRGRDDAAPSPEPPPPPQTLNNGARPADPDTDPGDDDG